jgi:hypothetical protein
VAGVLGLALLMPAGAGAYWWDPPSKYSQGMSIVIKHAFQMNAMTVDVYAQVTCNASMYYYPRATAWIKQAGAGRQIAYGMASGAPPFECDGSPQLIFLRITAEPGGVAFKGGAAMVAFQAMAPPWALEAATGWVSVRLKQWPNNKPWPEPPPMSGPVSGYMGQP